MTTPKRIRLYIYGFLIGCVMVYFILLRGRNRSYWFPENRVREQLMKGNLVFTEHAQCRMKCRAISEEEVREILKNGNVNFSESHPHPETSSGQARCPSYAIDGTTADKQNVRIVFASCDTLTTKVVTAIDLGLEKDTCRCN
ncbi:MAG: DUF4258 domain-containing protein [Bacteroidetes bacterium]|nr:DUF4258 domain-containing protein [Bacteroidota bacterium]